MQLKFLQLINWTPEQVRQMESQSHAKELVIAFVMSFLLVYILAHFVQYTKATNAIEEFKPPSGYGLASL